MSAWNSNSKFTQTVQTTNSISPAAMPNEWVKLNVGGRVFMTTLSTICNKEPNSMLARMFSQEAGGMCPSNRDSDGAYLIDRSSQYFEVIINYLRHGQLVHDTNHSLEGILEEAKFFGIEGLIPQLEAMIAEQNFSMHHQALTRRDVINAIIQTSHMSELRFQGVNLSNADLRRLDLRHINFKYASLARCNLSGANLSYCCLERADLSRANLRGAQLIAVRGLCANFEGADLQGSNFEDPLGEHANLEGVNLKGAYLEDSNLAGVNLRVANLRDANLKNCSLRAAVLAGADLERCNMSGSDLHEANLRGANFKDAEMEWMLAPLHMSQAIP